MVAINVLYSPPKNIPPAYAHIVDPVYGGWAGDLMTLLGEVTQYRINNNRYTGRPSKSWNQCP